MKSSVAGGAICPAIPMRTVWHQFGADLRDEAELRRWPNQRTTPAVLTSHAEMTHYLDATCERCGRFLLACLTITLTRNFSARRWTWRGAAPALLPRIPTWAQFSWTIAARSWVPAHIPTRV